MTRDPARLDPLILAADRIGAFVDDQRELIGVSGEEYSDQVAVPAQAQACLLRHFLPQFPAVRHRLP
jgi:hypothetical protein